VSIDRHDPETHPRCPPLGGAVPFRHCRTTNRGLPCHRIVMCWADRVDIAAYLRECFTTEEIQRMSQPPESRLDILLGTVARVRDRQKNG